MTVNVMQMTLREFVDENNIWFRGRYPETDASLDRAEASLGLKLPSELRWILRDYGYWHATGIESLEVSVQTTLDARKAVNLPDNLVILYDRGDAGVSILDTTPDESGNYRVFDVPYAAIPDQIESNIVYPTLLDYFQATIDTESEILDLEDIPLKI
ncbi:MAG: SMI1/KNR4 family protein [Verrucomicrobiota bacterium]